MNLHLPAKFITLNVINDLYTPKRARDIIIMAGRNFLSIWVISYLVSRHLPFISRLSLNFLSSLL